MYWRNQEKIVFYIILFILIVFQTSSAIVLRNSGNVIESHMLIWLVLNAVLLCAMVLYAKWVWKGLSIFRVLLKILIFVLGFVFCLFVIKIR